MSWVITILGIMALIVLHELGHFAVAKAVGMRVERFSLFFPPTIAKIKRGETEYAIGAIPAGGYVKITGMSPDELSRLDLRLVGRTYYMKPPWRRIAVILAGPVVNLVIAFVLFWVVLMGGTLDGVTTISNLDPSAQTLRVTTNVAGIKHKMPAQGVLRKGDRIVKVEGRKATAALTTEETAKHACPGTPVDGCRAAKPVHLLVKRDGKTVPVSVRPAYNAEAERMLIGFQFGVVPRDLGTAQSASIAAGSMLHATTQTVTGIAKAITSSKERSHVSSILGITEITEEAVATGAGRALVVIGYVSLVLGVVNLFPFLPLDGGHVLWSLAEKLRGRRVSLTAMWRFSSVGLILLAFLVISGVSNDIGKMGG